MSATRALDLDAAWRLHPQVALRPEPFGALLDHFGTRRLSFLKDRTVVSVITSLSDHPTASALRALGVDGSAAYPKALAAGGFTHVGARVMTALPGCLVGQFELGLDAPICLTWELTYA